MKISEISENTSAAFATSMGGGNGFANGGPGVIRRNKKKKTESVYAMNKEDPNNPEVLIQGYGRMPMDTLKRDIIKGIEEVLRNAEGDNWGTVSYAMYENGVLTAKVEALLNAIKELEDIRKKGGPKSRGINKR